MSADDPQLLIGGGRRRPGRPRVDERRDTSVTIHLRPSEHDALIALAKRYGLPMSALARRVLLRGK